MIVKLTGRIDSTNANTVEEAINKENGDFSGEITLDASNLVLRNAAL